MGSPLSPIVANLYIEHLEQAALQTTLLPPKLWLRYGTRIKKVNVLQVYYGYGRTTLTATGVLRLRLRAYDGYGRATLTATDILGLRLRAYYAYGYGRIAATTTGVLQAYYGLAAGCKLTSGHYNRER